MSLMPKKLGFQKGMNSSVGYSTVQQILLFSENSFWVFENSSGFLAVEGPSLGQGLA